jgi:tRNA A37 threonylcarbamoyladenosine synthetase subunit TsaC/SUA5/YrdC
MKVLLAQTDTIVGFLSQSAERLREAKKREESKPFLKVFCAFQTLKTQLRLPNLHKRRVRYARQTTFIVKNQAFRYVTDPEHARLIERYGWLYSTSANESGSSFDPSYCHEHADFVVEDRRGLSERSASHIYRLGRSRLKRLR